AQDVGVLASIGQAQVPVVRQPKVRLIATGNELLDPGETPTGARIVDSNTPMLRALLQRDGATLEMTCRLPDNKDEIKAALLEDGPDVIIATGGTSVGAEDWLPVLVQEIGDLPVHGIAMRPSAPTGIGRVGDKHIFLLPGNPVSCLCAYDFFAAPLLRRLAGLSTDWPHRSEILPLKRRIASQIGRVDYVRVAVKDGQVDP
ncbi:MAG: molybdopterin-binding protein, partial [Planctomycetota bacterium]|nr:molybdopterin-binding protein [Planctomycetota bacterium]